MSRSSFQIVVSPSAKARGEAARRFVEEHALAGVLVVGASRAAADELALDVARERGALAGVTRMSFGELATRIALPVLAERLAAPGSALGVEAMVARASFDAREAGELSYFDPVADLPGCPRAAARTLSELQLAEVPLEALAAVDRVGPDLAALARRVAKEAARAGAVSRADVVTTAAGRIAAVPDALPARHLLLLDVAVN
ncbi:MAG: hypothetical protein IT181_25255 [Acidobacteria bacterium]|nr:hypothetical protein [Acidobacteriota bacterium]